jgi:hypothetical protein
MPDVPEADQGHQAGRLAPGHPSAEPSGRDSAGPGTPAGKPPSAAEGKWSRADKINAVIAATALAVALVPAGRGIYDAVTAARAKISHASAIERVQKNSVCRTSFSALITASNIASDQTLWVLAQDDAGLWYPIDHFDSATPPPWQPMADIRSDLPIGEFVVIILTNSEDGSLVRYMQRLQTHNSGRVSQGVSSLPPGFRYLATWQPHLRGVPPGSCDYEFAYE